MSNYQIFAKSIKNRKDEHMNNGDFYLYEYLKEENLLFMVLSDGVGSTNCFWVASKLICERSYKHFVDYDLSDKSIGNRLLYSIEKANQDILDYEDLNCQGMLATLCIAVWDINKNKLYYAYAGDSRIYLYNTESQLIQITEDQKESIRLTQNDKSVFIDGSLATRNMITNAVGQDKVVIEIFSLDFNEGDSVFIATDGFYEVADPEEEIPSVIGSMDIENEFYSMMEWVSGKNIDDATVILLRRNDIAKNISFDKLPLFQKGLLIVEQLEKSCIDDDEESFIIHVNKLINLKIKLGKDNYSKIMKTWKDSNFYKNENRKIYSYVLKLRNII